MSTLKKPRSKRILDSSAFCKVSCLNDLINLGKNTETNQDFKKIKQITKELNFLNDLVGLDDLKNQIIEQIMFFIQGFSTNEMMHTCLMGPPGVGKTTVAEIIAKIYSKLGFLSHGNFIKVGREHLVGQYLGETTQKTKKVLKNAIGSVLFIDEAYSLGNSHKDDMYAKECIDTLNTFLSENTKNFVCIIAGYEEQLNSCFFAQNPGLERRFPWKYRLEKYSPINLIDIFKSMLNKTKWKLRQPHDCVEFLNNIIEQNLLYFDNGGGDISNFITSCKMVHSRRMFGAKRTWKRYLIPNDIQQGFQVFRKNKKVKEKNPLVEHMYI
tara:strand:+ start:3873 stop:4847 length:975 start_codon:yes stop_codon:yes gene_type:complete